MRVVTTCHKAGFDQYGHRWIESTQNWPKDTEFVFYTEGFDLKSVRSKRCEDLELLTKFKQKYEHYKPSSYEWDIVRFSNKVFAAYDAFYHYDGIGVWLDADCVTYEKIPDGYIESLLVSPAYMAMFKRTGLYTETGFWLMDCTHRHHKKFLDAWRSWFESGSFKTLGQWHDCTTLDATVRIFEKNSAIETISLSGEFAKHTHPMAKVELGKYIDHCKGPRKIEGISSENKHRTTA